jgi:predicted AlkP superfamily phosphohydrolase/phosphomutase
VIEQTSYRAFQQRETDIVPKHKVVFLGVDGADWQVIEPMMKEGKLKNFKSLMERGRWGVLESIKPIRSPMVWNTMLTGQNPDKHGIVEWLLSYSENRLVKGIWNILSEYNLKSTIINIPGTFPPEEFLGKEVSGFPFPSLTMNIYGWVIGSEKIKTRVTHFRPIELQMNQDGSYRSTVSVTEIISSKNSHAMKEKTLKNILIVHFIKERLSEICGETIDVARLNYYEDDKRIDILPLQGSDTPLASLHEGDWSDFISVQIQPGVVAVTKFKALKIDGGNILLFMTPFFSLADSPHFDFTFPKSLSKDLYELFGQYVVETTWWSAQDPFLVPAIVELVGEVEKTKSRVGQTLFDEKEWDLFIQIFTYTDRMQHLGWYFSLGKVPEELYINLFNADQIASDGKRAIEGAYVMADEWLGSMIRKIDFDKDVVFVVSDHGFTAGTGTQYLSGVHRLDGIYIVAGGPVNPVNRGDFMQNMSERKSVRDLTKNMLYMMGLPVGQDMAGEVWLDLISKSYLAENPVTTIPTYNKEESEKEARHLIDDSALEQLKGLGYLNGGGGVEGNTQ